jgi:protein gp37
MSDVFEDREDLISHRERLFRLIEETSSLNWLLLTKRSENIRRLSPKLGQPNVWLGTSAEDQKHWNLRVPILMGIPAVVHFVSAAPLLSPITMDELGLYPEWLIVGGESGPYARPMRAEWARSLRDQAIANGVAFHFKQWGGVNKRATGRILDGRTWDEFPNEKQ